MIEYYRFFATKEYAEEFISGNLYMKNLSYFWENGFEGQRDFYEGSLLTMTPQKTPFPNDLVKVIKGNVPTRMIGYRYCNICSFTRLIVNNKRKYVVKFDRRIKDFGDYVVRIRDFDEFLKRVINATIRNNDIAIGDPVMYFEPSYQSLLNCFCKSEEYNWQFEWRIAYLHDIEALKKDAKVNRTIQDLFQWHPFTLNIGDISDICELHSAEDMWNDKLNMIYPNYTIYETILGKGELDEEETQELIKEVDYGFGVNVNDESDFQRSVQSICNQKITMFRI